jgi:hypothetical protein
VNRSCFSPGSRRRWRGGAALAAGSCVLVSSPAAFAETPDPSSRDANYADVWLRLDADRSAVQAWAGGTQSWSGFDLGANLVLTQYYPNAWDALQNDTVNAALAHQTRAPAVRAEVGPALLFGSLFIQPKLGLGYDFELETVGPFVPQTTAIFEAAFVYVELWAQFHLYSPFEAGLQDSVYARAAVLASWNSRIGLGVQGETTLALKNFDGSHWRSVPLGLVGTVDVWGPLTLGVFAGGDVAKAAHYHFPVGRLTASYLF